MVNRASLLLEDGSFFSGESFGSSGTRVGEVVFNTAITGYQEILTDPSYKGQIVTMTYTEIGNYGTNKEDVESGKIFVEGFVVRNYSRIRSNFRSEWTLDEYMKVHNVVGIARVDTRKLTRVLRMYGSMKGIISSEVHDSSKLRELLDSSDSIVGKDMVKYVTTRFPYVWKGKPLVLKDFPVKINRRVVVIDFGVKFNSLRYFYRYGLDVIVVPAYTGFEIIRKLSPDFVFFSNGPGDPRGVPDSVVESMREILKRYPVFGICFGHQIIARCFGVDVYKMKFGHHGGNHPVRDITTGRIYTTSQNHNYAVEWNSAEEKGFEVTHVNLNDNTVEGFRHKEYPVVSVQYHPEAAPGPHDSEYMFGYFINNYLK